jgi:phospholipase D1/2
MQVLIADDRIVICGSANLNDRSQLGTHDSEIAIVVEDHTPVQSSMNGRPFQATRFAASLRRQLFRKHLGLLCPQDMQRPDANFDPVGVPNNYDWGSPEDNVVADPLSDTFQSLWNSRARQNTDIFRQVFRVVPDDNVRNWNEYKEFYEYYFKKADVEAQGQQGIPRPLRYLWGHIVRDDFPPGPEGIKQVKDLLSRVKGTLVEMPLVFLVEEDIAKEGISLNALTEQIYT